MFPVSLTFVVVRVSKSSLNLAATMMQQVLKRSLFPRRIDCLQTPLFCVIIAASNPQLHRLFVLVDRSKELEFLISTSVFTM